MYISDEKRLARGAGVYLGISAFCGLFSAVYEHFSHGVYSPFMVWLFAFPLLLGTLPFLLMWLLSAPCPVKAGRSLWHSAVAALTVGSCVQGVFEIYGTVSSLVKVYWIAGIALLGAVVAVYAVQCIKNK